MRSDGRSPEQLRPCRIEPDFISQALGSVLVTSGRTRVICTASLAGRAPPWLQGGGWVTAEYSMLPGATAPRGSRDPGGRGKEIQRLIGRALRAAVDLPRLVGPEGPLALVCDCDVIEADGGTRTAAITGGYVALQRALHRLVTQGKLPAIPLFGQVAAVSVGIGATGRGILVDLCYEEDSAAVVDLNVVKRDGGYVEIQGTGEHGTFDGDELASMLRLADGAIDRLFSLQREVMAR
jgi:ribonuclease PH